MAKSLLGLTLHAHLPFVRNPEFKRFLEEDWLFEAISETYLPLLRALLRLRDEGIPYRITISLSPTLCSMLSDKLLQSRYVEFAERLVELGDLEIARTANEPQFQRLAKMYRDRHLQNLEDFNEQYRQNILNGFKSLEDSGHIDIITTAATHAFLPLYQDYPQAIKAQIELAVMSHVSHFKKRPRGFWLPECGYFPGLEKTLDEYGLEYFYTATHAVSLAETKADRGVFAPVSCPNGVQAFARDYGLSRSVWSDETGYPADACYRDFYRDIGFDLDMDYIRPYIHSPEIRVFTGYKYWAITGKTDRKVVYDPDLAVARLREHAANFVYTIRQKANGVKDLMDRPPYFTIPFDAELFGHWWFEGVDWIEEIIRTVAADADVQLATPEQYLRKYPHSQSLQPVLSSWGTRGYSSVWLDGSNDWIYRHVHQSIERMTELASRFPDQVSLKGRFLKHAAREVLLSMASDWPFIISNGTSVGYAERRIKEHVYNFNLVYENMCRNSVNTEWLTRTEKKTNIFPDIDYRIFEE